MKWLGGVRADSTDRYGSQFWFLELGDFENSVHEILVVGWPLVESSVTQPSRNVIPLAVAN